MSVMVKNKTNKNYKRSQKGRSMVEMLGVLAIVGVLSVGGISAYGVAMKKHKANELLHQASMLATTLSAQAMTNDGKLPETTTSFANSSYGTFDQSVTEALDGKGFAITIKEVDSAVCGQLEKMVGGMVRQATCNDTTATLNYYKNLATNDEEGKNSPMGGSADGGETGTTTEPVDPACADVECPDGLTCFYGECKCPNGLFMCGDQCCPDGTYCARDGSDNKKYVCLGSGGDCTKNSDCDNGEFCNVVNGPCFVSGSAFDGSCTDLENMALTPKNLELSSGDLTVYLVSQKWVSAAWWGALNFCKAHGKQMVTMRDLGISIPNGKSYCFYDYAMADSAGETDSKCICLNDEGCIQTKRELSKLGEFVRLADESGDACAVYGIAKSYGVVDLFSRYMYDADGKSIDALCR